MQLPLARQIVLLLLIALLPILLYGVLASVKTIERTERLASSQLLTLAERAATFERLVIAEGFGLAGGLASDPAVHSGTPQACSDVLSRFVGMSNTFIFASFVGTDGMMRCSSEGVLNTDLSETPDFQRQLEEPSRLVSAVVEGRVTGRAVVVLGYPVYVDGDWKGVLSLSLPRDAISVLVPEDGSDGLQAALVDGEGRVLRGANDSAADPTGDWLPATEELAISEGLSSHVFRAEDRTGFERIYAYVPIEPGELSGVFSVEDPAALVPFWRSVLQQIALPLLIWVLCLALAYATMRHLVVLPIRMINRRMSDFRIGNRTSALKPIGYAPGEFSALSDTFRTMGSEMDKSERELSGLLDEKTVLLLEVYHRVKNNLQLIISIMNIQLRSASSDAERATIIRLRERIMGLALVHQRLYETPDVSAVPAHGVLSEIIVNLSENAEMGGRGRSVVRSELDDIVLHPDQAVPLSLLVTEALLNALRSADLANEDHCIDVSLKANDDNIVSFDVSFVADPAALDLVGQTGMTKRLIDAFVMQLGGKITMNVDDATKRAEMHVEFERLLPETMAGMMGAPGERGLRRVS
ncbi:sensor histidine kinase [Pontivivens insulae]|uniref:histidine kinase n=1 Tax=Pontivivens insulae TaxID=1639689 RepID=A0A2R8A6M1_9RHOB|nr:histidine kinase dimerization/phosphoacceptor domain -containing protein [Pontivivens insulae]RED17976.1 two-component sensor histidine kinase [Pontivivens insulae]SPF27865.1 putative sensor histidine kinase pdtaS [Pontivivens insulae]